MLKHVERVKACLKVNESWIGFQTILPSAECTGPEAFVAEVLQEEVMTKSDLMQAMIAGIDLFNRAKTGGRIRSAEAAAKDGKLSTKAKMEIILKYAATPEFAQAAAGGEDGINAFCWDHFEKNGPVFDAVPEAEAKTINEIYRKVKARRLGGEVAETAE